MLKKSLLLLISSFSAIYAFSQNDTTKLFFSEKFESDAFVEFGSRITHVNYSSGMDIDLALNWLINHKYYLGATYGQLASVEKNTSIIKILEATKPTEIDTKINYQTLGIRLGYILLENSKIISFSPDLTLGWVGVKLENESDETKLNGAYISPAIKGVFNVSDYFRIGVVLNYNAFMIKKYNSQNDNNAVYSYQLSSKNISGIGGGLFLRVGQF